MQRGYNKGLQQLAKIKNAVPAAARSKAPRTGATCAHLEPHHPGGGGGGGAGVHAELPPVITDDACRRRVGFAPRRSYSAAAGACEDSRELNTRRGLRHFASAATHANPLDPLDPLDPLGSLHLVETHYALTGEYRRRGVSSLLPIFAAAPAADGGIGHYC